MAVTFAVDFYTIIFSIEQNILGPSVLSGRASHGKIFSILKKLANLLDLELLEL